MQYLVYRLYDKHVVFTGTHDECERWVLAQAEPLSDGRRIFRTWDTADGAAYDVGEVYVLQAC